MAWAKAAGFMAASSTGWNSLNLIRLFSAS